MKKASIAAICATAVLLAAPQAFAGQGGGGDKVRYRCKAKGLDIEMSARFESRLKKAVAERKFRVELEAGEKAGLSDGDQFVITVDGANVGQLTVSGFDGDEIAGEARFNSRGKGESLPFPANFPTDAGLGSDVALTRGGATVIGCELD